MSTEVENLKMHIDLLRRKLKEAVLLLMAHHEISYRPVWGRDCEICEDSRGDLFTEIETTILVPRSCTCPRVAIHAKPGQVSDRQQEWIAEYLCATVQLITNERTSYIHGRHRLDCECGK
jgi:hypothetical protein